MQTKKLEIKNIILVFSIIIISLIISFSSLAYYNFKKIYDGSGTLPILNIGKVITNGTEETLKNIYYNGQSETQVEVKLNSNGNNISGYVRVKVFYEWSDSLNSLFNGSYACSVNYDTSTWTEKNGYLYLNQPLEKDSEVVLFDKLNFAELTNEYRGKKVDISLLCEIYQTANLPENWE